ncbi:MAG: ThuA domain-containing protein, partial [Kiritimatiellaeota bacterium]|nr:ThuA domain-containing protein [Kiritimatiellota bacterium]
IELLANRGAPGLSARLCDAGLYMDRGVAQAAAGAFRTCLQQPQFASALAFAAGSLTAEQRGPLMTAFGSVVQQLPDPGRVVREIGECVAKAKPDACADVLRLLAGLQSEEACAVLIAQMKTGDTELRKAIVRTLMKWSSSLALAPLLELAVADADAGVKVLAFRNALTVMDKPNVVSAELKLAFLQKLAQAAERKEEQKLILAAVKVLPGAAAAAYREELAKLFDIQDTEVVVTAINIGGKEVGAFKADARMTGGKVYAVNNPIDLSGAADAAPEAVYQSSRYENMSCAFDGLKPDAPYLLRLHFAELYHQDAGRRVCDVIANGTKIVENFDIVEKAGGAFKAVTETKGVTSDAQGKITVEFKTVRDQALVNGIELLEEVAAPPPAAANAADKIRVLILSGANNHDWKGTTTALALILVEDPRFEVTTTETPWKMMPADLANFDVLISNWNTWDKKEEERKKYEWDDEMKAAFLKWFKGGGGFFVLHSGSSMFYDWDDYHKLTAGAWGPETFHPHNQKFTLNVVDKEHPVTKGMTDFETFDEPWQKISNPNPNRHVLMSGVVSKENKGSGEVEPFVFVTQTDKGRCFTLLLGHDAKMMQDSEGCKQLILRGTAWAATGTVPD